MVKIKVSITAFSYKTLKDLSREFNLDIVYRIAKKINENKYSVEFKNRFYLLLIKILEELIYG